MRKILKTVLVLSVVALNAAAVLHSRQSERVAEKPVVAKPLRTQLKEVTFILVPNLVKA